MKLKIYLSVFFLCMAMAGHCQFVPADINFQNPSFLHFPEFISIVDESNVWLGTKCEVPYGFAVHSHDGGESWELDSIPIPGAPIISSLYAVDANTCYYVFTDDYSGGSIWKTGDRGVSWENKTGTLFSESGASR